MCAYALGGLYGHVAEARKNAGAGIARVCYHNSIIGCLREQQPFFADQHPAAVR